MHTLVTLEEAVIGLVIALAFAMLTAILMDLSKHSVTASIRIWSSRRRCR